MHIGVHFKNQRGFGLIETIIAVSIFALISVSAYSGFLKIMEGVKVLRMKNLATNLLNEQIEIIRNLSYSDVGLVDGLPAGKIPRTQNFLREGINFEVKTSIRDVDDPFDGTINGTPSDLSPADYKMVEISAKCENCNINEIEYYTRVSPLALETTSGNGALFVKVFDASGRPIQGADVNIINSEADPVINIEETTDVSGVFQIVNAPTGTEAYKIDVTKSGYSTDKTYTVGAVENPNPYKPHANISLGQVTEISFFIDKLSDLDVNTKTKTCEIVPNASFDFGGSKMIGDGVLKNTFEVETNVLGKYSNNNLEWDSYNFLMTDPSWDLLGSDPILPAIINPDSSDSFDFILGPKNAKALQISVVDIETGEPISGANIELSKDLYSQSLLTEDPTTEFPCIPLGQVLFQGLNSGEYRIFVSATGYQDFTLENFSVSSDWQSYKVLLSR